MESPEDRLLRFQGPPSEVIGTLTNSINNFFNPEIANAAENRSWSLMLMGIHAVALTVSDGLKGLNGESGYVWFLQTYMDRDEPGADFSAIGGEIHEWRNVLAHQWLATAGHSFALDSGMACGWVRREEITVLNPASYHDAYRYAFRSSSDLWRPDRVLSAEEMQASKERMLGKYQKR